MDRSIICSVFNKEYIAFHAQGDLYFGITNYNNVTTQG